MEKRQKDFLLRLARNRILCHLEGKDYSSLAPEDNELLEERAVFVTLNKKHNLRGCIGHMEARMSLYEAVEEMAFSAAFQDPRFSPLSKEEFDDVNIEISVLTPMQKINDYNEIRLGIDGVLVRKGFHSGVFLPQVADETGWDLDTFLSYLCAHKAGLKEDAYKDKNTELFIFQVIKFSE